MESAVRHGMGINGKPKDEIGEEIHEWRQAYAAQFDFDLDRMFADLKGKELLNSAPRTEERPLVPKPRNRV